MSGFNWFNRQFEEQKEQENTAEPEAATQAEPEAQSTEAEPSIDQNQLNWAKAAFENIKKRQQAEQQVQQAIEPQATSPAADAESLSIDIETAPESPVSESTVSESTVSESTVSESTVSESTVSESTVTDEATTEPIDSQPAAAESLAPEPAIAATTETPESIAAPVAPLPFWAQAEAERLERLERLKAEAIVEPEPEEPIEEEPETAADVLPTIPDFVLDEAFVWSAEVLAGQGRRPDQVSIEEITWLKRLRQGLAKTRRGLVNQLKAIVGQGPLNQDAVLEIEALLLQADVGVEATDLIVEALQSKLREEALPPQAAIAYLKSILRDMLDKPLGDSHSLSFVPEHGKLNIWLMTGVNGAGKTTTIGKIAHIAQKSGYNCLIGAADTFRAAAVQQVKVWGDRSNVEVIANPGKNTDPAAVVFDAITAAQARDVELLLIDTAGRLQNKKNLMDELSKIRRIIDKKAPDAKVESLLVLDATLGQNGLRQAEVFSEVAKLSGVVLTKLDGSARGGIALAVVQQLGLPIRFIGAGEGIEDLRPFSSYEFVEALLSG